LGGTSLYRQIKMRRQKTGQWLYKQNVERKDGKGEGLKGCGVGYKKKVKEEEKARGGSRHQLTSRERGGTAK